MWEMASSTGVESWSRFTLSQYPPERRTHNHVSALPSAGRPAPGALLDRPRPTVPGCVVTEVLTDAALGQRHHLDAGTSCRLLEVRLGLVGADAPSRHEDADRQVDGVHLLQASGGLGR